MNSHTVCIHAFDGQGPRARITTGGRGDGGMAQFLDLGVTISVIFSPCSLQMPTYPRTKKSDLFWDMAMGPWGLLDRKSVV